MWRQAVVGLWAVGFVLASGCGSKPLSSGECSPGEQQACFCAGGAAGTQRCLGSRSYGACECAGNPDGGALDGGSTSDGGPISDGGPSIDGGPATDGGASLDGGSVVDGGNGNQAPECSCPANPVTDRPQSLITLDQAKCRDPEGGDLTFKWEVLGRPEGSRSQLSSTTAENPTIRLDLATTPTRPYQFRATATDPHGATGSCEITVLAPPADGLYVELLWDQDQTDLDIHMLNPAGSAAPLSDAGWFDDFNDLYYQNINPDWGVQGEPSDDPRLVLDDRDGYGPELLRLSAPEDGVFTLGIHYFCDDDVGPSKATLRIFCNGALKKTIGPKELSASKVFWDAATVTWPGCAIAQPDTIRTISQGCQQ